MEQEIETLDSLKEEKTKLNEELETLDSETDKERISEINEKVNSLNDEIKSLEEDPDEDLDTLKERNKRLYARTKKAEGFVLEDGKWIKKPKPVSKPETKTDDKDVNEDVVNRVLDKRDLDSLDLSDNLKSEIQSYAKFKSVSIKKALNSEYIQSLLDKEGRKERVIRGTTGGQRRATAKVDYENIGTEGFDLRTPEGKEEYKNFQRYMRENLG